MHPTNDSANKQGRRDDGKHHLEQHIHTGWNFRRGHRAKRKITQKEMMNLTDDTEKIAIKTELIADSDPK